MSPFPLFPVQPRWLLLVPLALSAVPVVDPPPRWCDAVVAFHEVSYHPDDVGELGEWVELHSLMAVNLDLSGWSIAGGVEYTFPEGTLLPGGGYLLVARDPVYLAAQGAAGPVLGPLLGRLANDGEALELRDPNGRIMDWLEYDDAGRWPDLADGAGPTLARTAPETAGGDPSHWGWSVARGGTPGRANLAVDRSVPGPWRLLEVAAGSAGFFFLEMRNDSPEPLHPGDWAWQVAGQAPVPLPGAIPFVPPGGVLVVTGPDLGSVPPAGVVGTIVHGSEGWVADGVRLADRARGRREGDAEWRFVAAPTPGAANLFPAQAPVVINEIQYHAAPRPARQPLVEAQVVVPLGASWRYDQSGSYLSATFPAPAFNDQAWPTGTAAFHSLVGTPAAPPASTAVPPLGTVLTAGKRVYYFRHTFTLADDPAAWEWRLRHLLDDGAIVYLNGQEVFRWGMPAGLPASTTLASASVGTANFSTHITVPADLLHPGTNVLAVELRQSSTSGSNSDVFFALELLRERVVEPGQPFAESPEEWIELHHPGETPADLSGWTLEGAVGYTFPAGTVLPAGGYLVVAADPAALGAAHPGLAVLGPWTGGLGNDHEDLRLTDAQGNPVVHVPYYDRAPWPEAADGGGSTLELRDPRGPCDLPAAWAASDESAQAGWQTVTYRGVAGANEGPALWQEFVCGLLAAGELHLDDVSVVEDPAGTPRPLIRNGGFEAGLSPWRVRGTHQLSQVVVDPTQAGNHVLHLRASDGLEHEHNLVEITLADGAVIRTGTEYEISFRARWISGSRQFHTRLYFNRLARTHVLSAPATSGTPGRRNSRWTPNAGPLARALAHHPVVPAPDVEVTVTALLEDPDGVAGAVLRYRRDPATEWQSLPMTADPDGRHRARLPAGAAGQLTQFHVEARDSLSAVAHAPAAGPASAALWQADDGRAATTGVGTLRLLAPSETWQRLETLTEVASNHELPLTVVSDESEAYYDCGMRLKGSLFSRSNLSVVGYNFSLPAGRYFRGVLKSLSLDRKGSNQPYKQLDGTTVSGPAWQLREMLAKQIFNRAGGLSTQYDDLVKLITTGTQGAEYAQLMLARYSRNYLENQYAAGGDGALFKQELIYYPLRTTLDNPAAATYGDRRVPSAFPEAPKLPSPSVVYYVHAGDLGPDPEQYRQTFLVENNEERDDFSRIQAWSRYFGQPGPGTWAESTALMDPEAWMRAYAATGLICTFDNWLGSFTPHNLMLYVRPDDGRVVPLLWDNDFFSTIGIGLQRTPPLNEKITAHPAGERLFWGHLHDLATRVVTDEFIDYWGGHFQSLLPNDDTWPMYREYQKVRRDTYCLAGLPAQVPFAITTAGGQDFTVATPYAVIEGSAWIDVHSLRLAGRESQPAIEWISRDSWRVTLPLVNGPNLLTFEAVGYDGGVRATRAVTVTSTAEPTADPRSFLRVSELFYHPPIDANAEYVELVNIGAQASPLAGVRFANGIVFAFPEDPGLTLPAGGRALLVRDPAAFRASFGADWPLAGQYTGALDNSGERLRLVYRDSFGLENTISDFTYDDAWYPQTDGGGYSLVVRSELAPPSDWPLATHWRASWRRGGSPLAADTEPPSDYDWWREQNFSPSEVALPAISGPEADPDGDGLANWLEYALGFSPRLSSPSHALPAWQVARQPGAVTLAISFRRPVDALDLAYPVQVSTDLLEWLDVPYVPVARVPDDTGHEYVWISFTILREDFPRYLRLRIVR